MRYVLHIIRPRLFTGNFRQTSSQWSQRLGPIIRGRSFWSILNTTGSGATRSRLTTRRKTRTRANSLFTRQTNESLSHKLFDTSLMLFLPGQEVRNTDSTEESWDCWLIRGLTMEMFQEKQLWDQVVSDVITAPQSCSVFHSVSFSFLSCFCTRHATVK